MARRDMSPQSYAPRPTGDRPNGRPTVQYPPGFSLPQPAAAPAPPPAPPRPAAPRASLQIAITQEPPEAPGSLEYSKPIPLSPLFSSVPNPELDAEFALGNLGIDLEAIEPLLPNVYYVGSDAPLVNFGQYPVPRSYPHEPDGDPIARFGRFSDEALLFIFYLHCRDQLQERAHAELIRRKFVYDDGKWINTSDCVFDVEAWKFVQRDELGRIPQ